MTNERKTNQPAIDATILAEPSGTPYGLKLAFANGQTLEITAGQLSADIRAYGLIHGLKQKLVDAAAISRDPETGRAATIETKYAAVKEVYDRLLSGEWNKRREGGAGASGGLLFRALCRMYSTKTPEDIKAFLESKSDADKAQLRKNPKVAAVIEEIRAESVKPGDAAGSDDLLAGLED